MATARGLAVREMVGGAPANLSLWPVIALDVLAVMVNVVRLALAGASPGVRTAVGAAGRQSQVRVGRIFQRPTRLAAGTTDVHGQL